MGLQNTHEVQHVPLQKPWFWSDFEANFWVPTNFLGYTGILPVCPKVIFGALGPRRIHLTVVFAPERPI